jgi:hypothetical protein
MRIDGAILCTERLDFNNLPLGHYQGRHSPLAGVTADVELPALVAPRAAWTFDQRSKARKCAKCG